MKIKRKKMPQKGLGREIIRLRIMEMNAPNESEKEAIRKKWMELEREKMQREKGVLVKWAS